MQLALCGHTISRRRSSSITGDLCLKCDDCCGSEMSKMQKFETTNLNEMLRCRRSQFTRKVIILPLAGSDTTGLVHSVAEVEEGPTTKWVVNFIPQSLPTEFPLKKLARR